MKLSIFDNMKMLIESTQRPAIFTDAMGRRYVIGGTIISVNGVRVRHGVLLNSPTITVDDLVWKRPGSGKNVVNAKRYVKVTSKQTNNVYTVTIAGPVAIHCTCVGFSYRRRCKHLKCALQIK